MSKDFIKKAPAKKASTKKAPARKPAAKKKAVFVASNTSDAQIEAFEKKGSGHDQPVKKQIRMKRLGIDLPETLHQHYKIACAAQSKSMVKEVRNFIDEFVNDAAKKGIHTMNEKPDRTAMGVVALGARDLALEEND
jgi:hypothetical protein